LIESIGVKENKPIFPDLAFSLNRSDIEASQHSVTSGGESPIVGISTVAHQDPRYKPDGDPDRYESYLGKLTEFAAWLLEERFVLLLLRSQVHADQHVADDLKLRLRERGVDVEGRILEPFTGTYRDLLDQIARCELVVGGRFHCHVLPFVLGKPVLGVAYHPKTFDLMEYMGQAEYCVDIDQMDVSTMIEKFSELRKNAPQVREEVERRAAACREALDFQYDMLLGNKPLVRTSRSYLPSTATFETVE